MLYKYSKTCHKLGTAISVSNLRQLQAKMLEMGRRERLGVKRRNDSEEAVDKTGFFRYCYKHYSSFV